MTLPQRPAHVSEYALACLEALASARLGQHISLGGAFGLAHYFEYRTTHDVDAWWVEPVTAEQRQRVIDTLEKALKPFGPARIRSWGDVVSVELSKDKQTVFSFQIARRSAELQSPTSGPWPGGIRIDSFDDLVASKMVALVERGAPRDFRDIYTLCRNNQYSIERCWKLWTERQLAAGEDADRLRAAVALQTHLSRFEQARPLEKIADPNEKSSAEQLRSWFIKEFIRGLAD